MLLLFIAFICYLPILDSILPKTNFGAGIPDIGPSRLGSYLLFLAFMVHCAATKKNTLMSNWTRIITIFFIIVIASILWANCSYSAYILQGIFDSVFIPLFVAVVAMNLFRQGQNGAKLYIKHIIIASLILSVTSIAQMILGVLTGQEEIRATGMFSNPNGLAIFLVLTIPAIMYGIEKQLVSGVLGRVAACSVIGGILCTVSRKGIVTMVLCFCLYNFFKKDYRKIAFSIVAVIIVCILLSGYAVISHRFEQDELQHDIEGKWNMTYAGWKMFLTSPIIGLGYRGYYDNFSKYFPWSSRQNYDSHNIFITALANYGLVGFIPFMGIFLYPLFRAIKIVRQKDRIVSDEYSKDMAIVCICCIIPFMISGWFAGGLFYSETIVSLLYTNIALFLSTHA
jgi:O-antigen ligase